MSDISVSSAKTQYIHLDLSPLSSFLEHYWIWKVSILTFNHSNFLSSLFNSVDSCYFWLHLLLANAIGFIGFFTFYIFLFCKNYFLFWPYLCYGVCWRKYSSLSPRWDVVHIAQNFAMVIYLLLPILSPIAMLHDPIIPWVPCIWNSVEQWLCVEMSEGPVMICQILMLYNIQVARFNTEQNSTW